MQVMADRPQIIISAQRMPTFVDDIYSRQLPIQADIPFVIQVNAVRGSQPQARPN